MGGLRSQGYPFGPLFKLLLLTAQRRSEVAGMKWAELDAEGWLFRRQIQVEERASRPLIKLRPGDPREPPPDRRSVFIARADKPVRGWSKAKSRVDSLCSLAIGDWHLHDLRRTAATQMRSLGVRG